MSNLITIEQIGTAVPTDKIILADQTRVKAENNMWEKPLAIQTALVDLEEGIVDGASEETNTFKKVEEKITVINTDVEERYTKAEVDDKVDLTRVRTHVLPENAHTDIGSPSKRFRSIYVDEAYLSTNTLYIGDTPILGTDADTIMIKADPNQSILVSTTGTGTTSLSSAHEVSLVTNGMNADVKVQATGVNSKVRLGGTGGIELATPTVAQSDFSVTGNLTLTGNFVHNGQSFVTNATTVTTKDNIIVLNQGEVGSGVTAGRAGIQIDRGDEADFQLIFNETTDKFTVGTAGGVHETLATREYTDSVALNKVDIIVGKGLSTEDYTTAEKNKLAGLSNYTLPVATSTITGGIKIGAGLTITDGKVSVIAGGTADNVNWSGVTDTPTTLNGYGITTIDCGSIV